MDRSQASMEQLTQVESLRSCVAASMYICNEESIEALIIVARIARTGLLKHEKKS